MVVVVRDKIKARATTTYATGKRQSTHWKNSRHALPEFVLIPCLFCFATPPPKVVFERFADTLGTYHNHTQIVPLPATLAPAARRAFEKR